MGKRACVWAATIALLTLSFTDPQKYTFKVRFSPNSSYNLRMDMRNSSSINFIADKETLALLWNSGFKNPTKSSSVQNIEETITTGNADPNGSFFIRITVDKFDNTRRVNGVERNDLPTDALRGMEISGICTQDNQLTHLRVEGGQIPEEVRDAIASIAENIVGSIKYPNAPIAIGDSFLQQMPVDIPVPGHNPAHLQIVVNYKLTAVDGDTAFFNNTYTMRMTQTDPEYKLNLDGGGTGTTKHDLRRNFYIENQSNLKMTVSVKTEKFQMVETSDVRTSMSYH